MGHIRKRGHHQYQARWIGPDSRECVQVFKRKIDAENHIKIKEAEVLHGTYVDTTNKITVAEYARQWAAIRPHRPATAARVNSMIDTHLADTPLGRTRLSDVRPSAVQAWATSRTQVLSPSTVRLLVQLLRSIFGAAALDRLIASNPVIRLSLPRSEQERIIPLTVAQVQALADAMPERCQAMVIAQAGLGLRIGELLALHVQDVNFLGRTVRIESQLSQDGKTRVPPKTPKSPRTLPLPDFVAQALSRHISEIPPAEDGPLFSTATGKLYRQEHYGARVFAPAVRKAGLPGATTSHALRHHYASALLAAGESVVAVAERLGHENATLVLKVYGHLVPGSEDRTRRALDAAWASDGQKAGALTIWPCQSTVPILWQVLGSNQRRRRRRFYRPHANPLPLKQIVLPASPWDGIGIRRPQSAGANRSHPNGLRSSQGDWQVGMPEAEEAEVVAEENAVQPEVLDEGCGLCGHEVADAVGVGGIDVIIGVEAETTPGQVRSEPTAAPGT